MVRYHVESKANPGVSEAWADYLAHHLAEVVLAGGFTGATLVRDGDTFRCDYDAPSREALDRYFTDAAPALRADSEARFPAGVARTRAESPLSLRVSAPFAWASLGVVDEAGVAVPCPADGPFTLVYYAPWCIDCRTSWPGLVSTVQAAVPRAAFVRVYSTVDEGLVPAVPEGLPRWSEPSEKTDVSRVRTFHATLRQLAGERAKWGVPAVRRLWVVQGRFVVLFGG